MFLVFLYLTCSAQLRMFHVERRSRNTLIITIIFFITKLVVLPTHGVLTPDRPVLALTL